MPKNNSITTFKCSPFYSNTILVVAYKIRFKFVIKFELMILGQVGAKKQVKFRIRPVHLMCMANTDQSM